MKKYCKFILSIFFLFFFEGANAKLATQQCKTFRAYAVSNVKSKGQATVEQQSLNRVFKNYSVFSLDGSSINQFVKEKGVYSSIRFQFDNLYDWSLQLEKYDVRSPDYVCKVATDRGIEILPPEETFTYKGYCNHDPSSDVRLSIRDNILLGSITDKGETFFIEPVNRFDKSAPGDHFVIYTLKDLIQNGVECGVGNEMNRTIENGVIEKAQSKTSSSCSSAKIAIAADYSMVLAMGSPAAVQKEIIDILNLVDGFYNDPRIQISYSLVATYISTSTVNDPWSATTQAQSLLDSFKSWGNNGGFGAGITYAVASLWTTRNFCDGSNCAVIGRSFIGSACNSNKHNVLEHFFMAIIGHAIDQSHELGHNWNAVHSCSCSTDIMSSIIAYTNTKWDNMTISSIVGWKDKSTCLTNPCPLKSPVANFISDVQLTCDGKVKFTDQSLFAPDSWSWDFGDGQTSIQQNPTHTYAMNGMYRVKLIVSNSGGNDQMVKTGYIIVEKSAPNVADGSRCGPGVVNLTATGFGTINWYTTSTGGTPVSSGPDFSASVTSTTTYYVESSSASAPQKAGPADNTIGPGQYIQNGTRDVERGMIFSVLSPLTFISVKVYANSAGDRTIQLFDRHGGKLLYAKTVTLPVGESRVNLGFDLISGTDYFMRLSATNVDLYANSSSAKYPYLINNLISIRSSDYPASLGTPFYFFYDWEVQAIGCTSSRIPITVKIDVCTGIASPAAERNVSVYPNPVKDVLEAKFNLSKNETINIEVINLLGQVKFSYSNKAERGKFSKQINASDFSPGIYTLQIKIGEQIRYFKVVKEE